MLQPSIRNQRFDRLFGAYGELIHETCDALVPPGNQPVAVFRSIVRELRKGALSSSAAFEKYERAWVFRIVAEKIRRHGRHELIRDPEHRTLFSSEVTDPGVRLERTQRYLLRLPVDARIAVFLSHRHGFPDAEIASILQAPPDSIVLLLRQARDTLREWIWQDDAAPADAEDSISSALKQWTSVPLPEELKQTPLANSGRAPIDRKSRWQRTPWYVRSGMEALALATVILAVVALVPKARNIYERSLERQLDSFELDDEDLMAEESSQNTSQGAGDDFKGAEDESGVGSAEEGGETADPNKVTVGASQIWRFYVRTHSPAELRPLIQKALKDANVPPASDNPTALVGVEAPGGIQFNLLVPTEVIPKLKTEIRAIASKGPEGAEANITGNFTWYVTKARSKIPKGQTKLVVWLYRLM